MHLDAVLLLKHFSKEERDIRGNVVVWEDYDLSTMQEVDRLREEIGSSCHLIRGNHGPGKESAIDCVFPHALYAQIVMALFRSSFSKGIYQGGSVHLDSRKRNDGLSRAWIAFHEGEVPVITKMGFASAELYRRDSWVYYNWSHPQAFLLVAHLIYLNTPKEL